MKGTPAGANAQSQSPSLVSHAGHGALPKPGPAGTAVISTLFQMEPVPSILWVDPEFKSGRLSSFTHVPANTKVKLFTQFIEHSLKPEVYKEMNSFQELKTLPQEKSCQLRYASDLVTEIGIKLEEEFHANLFKMQGKVLSLSKNDSNFWQGVAQDQSAVEVKFHAKAVFMATGCHPRPAPLFENMDSKVINPEDMLDPSKIQKLISHHDRVAVIGSSHTSVLIIKNLMESSNCPSQITNFYRLPLKYAKYLEDGRIQHDNTGLKGEVAVWSKENMKDCDEDQSSISLLEGKIIRLRTSESEENKIYKDVLPSCDKIIWAIGYNRNPLPSIFDQKSPIQVSSYDGKGNLLDDQGKPIDGLYGVGIAFPQRVVDVDGSNEYAVGLWKFMKHIKNIVPEIHSHIMGSTLLNA